jgi:hypothetical protein
MRSGLDASPNREANLVTQVTYFVRGSATDSMPPKNLSVPHMKLERSSPNLAARCVFRLP